MKIGILQAGHTPAELLSKHGDYDGMFCRLLDGHGFSFAAYDVENMVFPGSIRDADGWVVTGSKHGAYEDHPFIPPLERFIREAHAGDVPLVGVCFGHQIAAQALGGRVVKHPEGWSVGRRRYETAGGGALWLNAWHQDQVAVLPEGAVCLAGNAFCPNAIVAYGDRMFTVQPHPEYDGDLIADFVGLRRGTGSYPDARMDAALANRDGPVDKARLGRAIARFFLERRTDVEA